MTDNGSVGPTKGPWIADLHNEQRDGGRFIAYVRGGNNLVPIAAVPTGVEGYGREEGRANARLIAAAPDLRDALRRAMKWLAICDDPRCEKDFRLAEAALQKAGLSAGEGC